MPTAAFSSMYAEKSGVYLDKERFVNTRPVYTRSVDAILHLTALNKGQEM